MIKEEEEVDGAIQSGGEAKPLRGMCRAEGRGDVRLTGAPLPLPPRTELLLDHELC